MNISVLAIFPQLLDNFWSNGVVKKAITMGKLSYSSYCIRDFAPGKHKIVDDRPFGGGCGMIIKPNPVAMAIGTIKKKMPRSNVILLSPHGKKLDQKSVAHLLSLEEIILLCGRYEGIDERIVDKYVDFEISIGDYVLTGGELAAMVIIDALVRLIPGVLGNSDSSKSDTFSSGLVKHAQYTRPKLFENESVPEVLISGNHGAINRWRVETSLIRTLVKRKDLLDKKLSPFEVDLLDKWRLRIEKIIQKQSIYCTNSLSRGQ